MTLRLALLAVILCGVADTAVAAEATNNTTRNFNLSLNPFSLLSGDLAGGVDFRVSDRVSVGPYGHLSLTHGNGKLTENGGGIRTDIALSSTTFNNGWYLSPFISKYHFHMDSTSSTTDASATDVVQNLDYAATSLGAVLGYGWYWSRGINLRLGGGLMYTKLQGNYDVENPSTGDGADILPKHYSGILPVGELILAWAL